MADRDAKGRFKRGYSGNPRGRKRGVRNRVPSEVREMVREALIGVGGVEYLKLQAEVNPVSFMSLCAKLIPAEVRASLQHDDLPIVVLRDFSKRAVGINAEVLGDEGARLDADGGLGCPAARSKVIDAD